MRLFRSQSTKEHYLTKQGLVSLCLALIMAISSQVSVFAVKDEGFYAGNDIIYYDPDAKAFTCPAQGSDGGGGGAGSTTGTALTGGPNIEKAFRYFIDKRGLTEAQSAGIVGNLIVESPGVNPTIHQGGGGPGRGIAQWEVGGRWDQLLAWAKKNGNLDPLALSTQLDYLWHELQTTESAALSAIKGANDVSSAAKAFMLKFERPADKSPSAQNNRARIAKTKVLDVYGTGGGSTPVGPQPSNGNSSSPSATADCSTTSDPSGGGAGGGAGGADGSAGGTVGIVNGFAFPLKTTQSIIKNNSPRWCLTNQSNCHHDYNAADIFSPTGTQVVAAAPGTVKKITLGVAAHLNVLGSNYNYYYQHMSSGTIVVRTNQHVNAGDTLGKVGTRADAWNTATHLHFDMLPSPPYNGRVSCSAGACTGYPFVNVQPLLIKAFNALP